MSASLQEAPPDSATTTTPAVLDGDSTSVAPNQALSIVFTDIEESTALWETVPDSMRIALQLHDDIMRAGIRAHNGYEVKVIGDGFMVAFQKANDALTWCLDTQWDLLNADWPPEVLTASYAQEVRDKHGHLVFRGLRVRMSIHWGTPIILVNSITRRLEYIGPMVHRTARCMSIAKGGQLVVTHDFLTELARSLGVAEFQDGEPQEGIDGQGMSNRQGHLLCQARLSGNAN